MKTTRLLFFGILLTLSVGLSAPTDLRAGPGAGGKRGSRVEGEGHHGKGHKGKGHKGGGHEKGRGGMPDEFRDVIHGLFAAHEGIERKVEMTETGYRATTTSADPALAEKLQEHVAQMKGRLDTGKGVRRWDPAFEEFRRHYEEIETRIEPVDGGVVVEVRGTTPDAIAVAQNHARIVTGFVEKGEARHHATHEPALEASKK